MSETEIALSEAEFARVVKLVHQLAGIALSPSKRTMVTSRLGKMVKARGLPTYMAYLERIETAKRPDEVQEFVNALTTNLTRFFREDHHFDHLRDYVGTLLKAGGRRTKRMRIWSAGCSTGQEAYTIAVDLLAAYPELKSWDFRILATDIDTDVVARAARGRYPLAEIAELEPARQKLFEVSGSEAVMPAAARHLISFKPLNLLGPWPVKGPFDAIFCRNVTIYFDKPTQGELFSRFARLLAPGGYLYIGHSENIGLGGASFTGAGRTIYQVRTGHDHEAAA